MATVTFVVGAKSPLNKGDAMFLGLAAPVIAIDV